MAAWFLGTWAALALLATRPPAFVYDASMYWAGATAVVEGQHVYVNGGLDFRGVFTSVVYVPAYFVSQVAGGGPVADGWAVAGQNALLVALLGAVVIPLLLRRVVTLRARHVTMSSALTGLVLSGFVPYPLMDLSAMIAIVLAILLLTERRWWAVLAGGVLLALAMNLRPAYAVPAVLVLLVVAMTDWRRSPLAVVGGAAVLATQYVYGAAQSGISSVMPPTTRLVTQIQFNYSPYVVRYDTVPFTAEDPRLWHCSPAMAETLGDRVITSSGDLLGFFVDSLPGSALLAVQKVAASLHWNAATPYGQDGQGALRPLGVLVIALTAAGLVALVPLLRRSPGGRAPVAACIALALGSMVTLVGSTPEARFALPLVAAGLVGTVAAVARWWHRDVVSTRGFWVAAACAAVLAVLVAGVGWQALQQDSTRGEMTADTCRTA
jgi:hypothetical protein